MKTILFFAILLISPFAFSQVVMTLTPRGFASVEVARPEKGMERLTETSRAWADVHNKREYDVYDITANSLKIDGVRENAFFYRNRGETFYYNIRYTLDVVLNPNSVTVTFSIKDIFTRQTLSELTVADLFTSDGKMKDDYDEVKPSLEQTATDIVNSYAGFIIR